MSEENTGGIKITSEITNDVPFPTSRTIGLPIVERLENMQVGDSFTVEVSGERNRLAVSQRISRYKKKNPPKNFSMLKESEETYRIYRIEDRDPDEIHQ